MSIFTMYFTGQYRLKPCSGTNQDKPINKNKYSITQRNYTDNALTYMKVHIVLTTIASCTTRMMHKFTRHRLLCALSNLQVAPQNNGICIDSMSSIDSLKGCVYPGKHLLRFIEIRSNCQGKMINFLRSTRLKRKLSLRIEYLQQIHCTRSQYIFQQKIILNIKITKMFVEKE